MLIRPENLAERLHRVFVDHEDDLEAAIIGLLIVAGGVVAALWLSTLSRWLS